MATPVAPEHSAQCSGQEQVPMCHITASRRLHTGTAPAPACSPQRKGDPEVPGGSWESGGAGGDQTHQGPHWPGSLLASAARHILSSRSVGGQVGAMTHPFQ